MNFEVSGHFNRVTHEPLDLLEQLARSIGTTESALLSSAWEWPRLETHADYRLQALRMWKPMRPNFRSKRRIMLQDSQGPLY